MVDVCEVAPALFSCYICNGANGSDTVRCSADGRPCDDMPTEGSIAARVTARLVGEWFPIVPLCRACRELMAANPDKIHLSHVRGDITISDSITLTPQYKMIGLRLDCGNASITASDRNIITNCWFHCVDTIYA